MYSAEEIFLMDLDTLRKAVSQPSAQSMISCGGLMRKMFLDGGALVDQVNRAYGIKLKFQVKQPPPLPPPPPRFQGIEPKFQIDNRFNPATPGSGAIVEVNSNQFLKLTAVPLKGGEVMTFMELILYVANVLDVHKGAPHEKEKLLEDAVQTKFILFGMYPRDLVLQTFRIIVQIALKGLEPLELRVRENPARQRRI